LAMLKPILRSYAGRTGSVSWRLLGEKAAGRVYDSL
jgi:hypothetical protein